MKEPKPLSMQLLVLRASATLSREQAEALRTCLSPVAEKLGAVVAIEDPSVSMRLEPNLQDLLTTLLANTVSSNRVAQALERLAVAITNQTQAIDELIGVEDHDEPGDQTLDGR